MEETHAAFSLKHTSLPTVRDALKFRAVSFIIGQRPPFPFFRPAGVSAPRRKASHGYLILFEEAYVWQKNRLRLYDENICRHTKAIGAKRGGIRWKYFQYLSLLFTEMYLDRYFSDRAAFCADLNAFLQEISAQASGRIRFAPYTPDKMNKLAFMCATGSGKTLLMHVNILQFLHYFRRAQRQNSRLSINKVIVLAPAEGWYTLLIPQKQLEIDSVQKLEAATDYAAPAL